MLDASGLGGNHWSDQGMNERVMVGPTADAVEPGFE